MSSTKSARAVADVDEGLILATVTIAVPPDRVFRAITSDEVVKWWGSDPAILKVGILGVCIEI